MNAACRSFRALLESKLAGRPDPGSLRSLSWHEHLLGCAACRALLEDEEALEGLLATLPEPRLPPEIKRRVLVALARSRAVDAELDRLLDLDPGSLAPTTLASDVLARLAHERGKHTSDAGRRRTGAAASMPNVGAEAADAMSTVGADATASVGSNATTSVGADALDTLLDRAGAVHVPAGLDARVLRGLRADRAPRRRVVLRKVWAYAAAAGLVAALTAWAVWPRAEVAPLVVDSPPRGSGDADGSRAGSNDPTATTRPAPTAGPDTELALVPDPQMLAAFDALENWELLNNERLDVTLSTLSPADEAVIEFEEGG